MVHLLAALALILTGCTHTTTGTPIEEPQQVLHCDLIFPAPSRT